jgi:hypothetical protein
MKRLISFIILFMLCSTLASADMLSLTNITVKSNGSSTITSIVESQGGSSSGHSGSSFVVCGNHTCGVNQFCENKICKEATTKVPISFSNSSNTTTPIQPIIQPQEQVVTIPEQPQENASNTTLIEPKKPMNWMFIPLGIAVLGIIGLLIFFKRKPKEEKEDFDKVYDKALRED